MSFMGMKLISHLMKLFHLMTLPSSISAYNMAPYLMYMTLS